MSTTWFVSTGGSNQNPGTLSQPFQTIQAAANVAQAGDHVEIMGGVYHETVTPQNSGTAADPIVYEAYDGQAVTISGADPLRGWSLESGAIYEASMPIDLGAGSNQVFVDGKAIAEARYPNSGGDLLHPALETIASALLDGTSGNATATINDPNLNQSVNYWRGATIAFSGGDNWVWQTGTVTSSAPGQITISYQAADKYQLPKTGNLFYLTGAFKALDAAGEWYRDPSTDLLHLWTPASDSPAAHDVEVQTRQYAFDLSGVSYNTLSNVSIFAATVATSTASAGTVLDHLTVTYAGQALPGSNAWVPTSSLGIALEGASSTLENSTISQSSGDGVFVSGAGSRITNNVIHDVDTAGTDNAAIRVSGDNIEVDHNTIYRAGRDGIKISLSPHAQIIYNTIHDAGLLVTEAGGVYTVQTNGAGSTIADNRIYDMHSGGFGETALFLDNYSSNYVVSNNHVWNVDYGLKLNFTSRDDQISNNTLDATLESIFSNYQGDWDGTRITNNLLSKSASFGRGAVAENNTTTGAAGVGADDFTSGSTGAVGAVGSPVPTGDPVGSGDPPPTTGGGSGGSGSSTPPTVTGITTPPPVDDRPLAPAVIPPVVASPPPAPTLTDLAAAVSSDQSAIASAIFLRKSTLAALAAARRAAMTAYRAARQQLNLARRSAHRPGSTVQASVVTALTQTTEELFAAWQQSVRDLASHRRTDFTGIRAARHQLALDRRVLRQARLHHLA